MNELITMEDAIELDQRMKNPRVKARSAWLWYEIMEQHPNPWDDEEFFNIPTFIRQEEFKNLYV